MINVCKLSQAYEDLYEDFVSHHDGSLIYYSLKFRNFLCEILNAKYEYYIALKENKITGVLPLIYKTGSLGKVINSLPFYGSNGGILANDIETKQLLLDFYKTLINKEDVAAATLIENPFDKNYNYSSLETSESDYRIGQLTKIAGQFKTLEDLMCLFHFKTRNVIRKAIKSDIRVSIDNTQINFLKKIHNENMLALNGLPKSDLFFENIEKYFDAGIDYNIYIGFYNDVRIAALLVFYYNKTVEYYTPVIDKNFRNLQSLSLIIATAMFDAANKGFEWWNWGGTWTSQKGVYDFKSKWGTIDENYNYHITVNNKNIYNATKQQLLNEYNGFYVLPFDKLLSHE